MRHLATAILAFSLLPALAGAQDRNPSGPMMPGRPPLGGPMMDGGMMGNGMMGGMMGPGMKGDDWMGGMATMRMMGMSGMFGMMDDADSHIDGRIAFLKAELKLNAEQTRLFEPVEKLLRDWTAQAVAHPRGAMMMAMMRPDQSLPERLGGMETFLTQRLDAVHKLKAAIDPLYATLSPPQRAIADRFLLRMAM